MVVTVITEGRYRLEIPTDRPGFYVLNFSPSTKGESRQVLLSAYLSLGHKKGEERGRIQKLSVV